MARGNSRLGCLILAVLFLAAVSAIADTAEATGCAAFKWPVSQEQALFSDTALQATQSGSTLSALPDHGVSVPLLDTASVKFALPPAGKPKDGAAKGAKLSIAVVAKASIYQVTLSDEAWIDLVQAGKFVESLDHSGAKDCPGVRKTVRFMLSEGPLVLQISKSSAATLMLAIRPVP